MAADLRSHKRGSPPAAVMNYMPATGAPLGLLPLLLALGLHLLILGLGRHRRHVPDR